MLYHYSNGRRGRPRNEQHIADLNHIFILNVFGRYDLGQRDAMIARNAGKDPSFVTVRLPESGGKYGSGLFSATLQQAGFGCTDYV